MSHSLGIAILVLSLVVEALETIGKKWCALAVSVYHNSFRCDAGKDHCYLKASSYLWPRAGFSLPAGLPTFSHVAVKAEYEI